MTDRPQPPVPSEPGRRRKIAYVTSRYPGETFIIREVLALERAGVEVLVYTLKPPFLDLGHEDLRETGATPYHSPNLLSARLLADNIAAFLSAPARYVAFPLTQAWAHRAYPLQALKTAALFPKMVHYARHMKRSGVGGANSCWASLPAMLTLVGKRFVGTPYCMTCRAWDIFVAMNQVGLDVKVSEAAAIRTNHGAASSFMKRFCRTPADERKIACVYNPFDVGRVTPRDRAPEGPFTIVSGGRLTEKKGLRHLLDAAATLQEEGLDCRVVIVGEGDRRAALEAQVARLGLADRVEFTGQIPNQELLDRIRTSHAFVLPCVPASDGSMDGIPNVLIESLALGVPVVSTGISGIPELVEDGVSGLLAPPGDAAGLAAAIRRLAGDPGLQERLSRDGRRRVARMFDMDGNARALIRLYENAGLL